MSDPLICRANGKPFPDPSLPLGEWILETMRHMREYEPCGQPATHVAYGGSKPLCERHAEELRIALRNPNTFGNALAGGRPRTERQIAQMVRPIQ